MPDRTENFNEWYNEIVEEADLCDKRYPIKGMNVWTPYGWKCMRLIDGLIREELEASGHGEVCFPLLISDEQFAREAEHIKGFDDEVYWVTRAGGEDLEVKLLLRPTSETAMYPIFALWVRSHADMPLKTFQLVNTFRYDTKQTRAFIRVREIHFFEAHTCHADFEDAERQIKEDLEIMERLGRKLCLPYLTLKRPEWDKFPGAYYSIAADALMPSHRTLQIGTIHQYRDNFAKAYDIKYEDESGEHKYAHQTTYGMSERLLGAIVGIHGDDKGVILPPDIAPYQVVIVPIPAKGSQETVYAECEGLLGTLRQAGLRAHVDLREHRPGNKFYHWELRGVPLRLELGLRDMEKGVVTLARRDNGEKTEVSKERAPEEVKKLLADISASLWDRAKRALDSGIMDVEYLEDLGGVTDVGRGAWCEKEDCAAQIETQTELKILGTSEEVVAEKRCLVCGQEGKVMAYIAKSY